MAVVTFVYADWQAMYPQFAATVTTSGQAQGYFDQATMYCDNSTCAIVPYDPTATPPITIRLQALYLLTAHIAQLFAGSTIGPPSPIVGRINTATQGSVAVGADSLGLPGTAAWFTQTQFGLMAYQMMAKFRTARYRASPGRFYQPPPYPIAGGGYGVV